LALDLGSVEEIMTTTISAVKNSPSYNEFSSREF